MIFEMTLIGYSCFDEGADWIYYEEKCCGD